MAWTVYIIGCADKTFYTGITNDMENRLAKHASGKGAKYTRGRGPLKLVYTEQHCSKGRSLKREAQIKKLRRNQKMELVKAALFFRSENVNR